MIPDDFIQEIQSKLDIADVISGYFPLKKAGRNFKACCPFHSEKTPSFVVSPQKQIFHCFGCGQGGGVFQFLMQMEKISFPEAVEMLAKKLGMTFSYRDNKDGQLKNQCFEALAQASRFYHSVLTSGRCQEVLKYLKSRGIGEKTIAKFCLGFAPGKNSLIDHLRKKGFTLNVLEKASLANLYGQNIRDVFSERILFPIFDVRNRVVGFGGRLWKEAGNLPKYVNSSESLVYSKREVLFGLNLAKNQIIKEKKVLITEGYLDVVTPFMRGIENIVASLGTSLTQEQIKLIGRFCSKVVLIFDSDDAGQQAVLRTLDLLLENQIEPEIVDLPSGEDPDSIARKKGKDYFLKLIACPNDFFSYKIRVLKKQYDSQSISGKSQIAASMLETLSKIEDQVLKYQYLAKLAQELKIKEEAIISEYKRRFPGKNNFSEKNNLSLKSGESAQGPLSITEKILIKAIADKKGILSLVKKNFSILDFSHPLTQKAAEFFLNRDFKKEISLKSILANIEDKQLSSFISKIILEEDIPQDQESLKESLLQLKKRQVRREREKIKSEIEKADSEGDKQKLEKLIEDYNKAGHLKK